MGGLRYINGHPGEDPPRSGISLGDSLAGMFAAQGLLAALYQRAASPTGEGQVIDVSILESCFALLESTATEYDVLRHVREPSGSRLPGIAPSSVFRSSDGKQLVIAANQDTVFQRLCVAMGRPELADDPRYADHAARGEHQLEIEAEIEQWADGLLAHEIDTVLNAAGVVCGPINSIADIFADDHVWEREMLVKHQDPKLGSYFGPGILPKFSETPGAIRWTGPWEPGAHNAEVLGGLLGCSAQRLDTLAEQGVI
jgi:formyl-CoA transferase